MLSRIRIVLCQPSHPGNIGAAARAMKTMGIAELRIIGGASHRAPEALAMAANSGDVLERARLHANLDDALGDCVAAFALSARPREWAPRLLDVREAALQAAALAAGGPIAFVFGNETTGLSNEEMFACQYLVRIPTSAEFHSLNLAQAVQVVVYELRMAAGISEPRGGAHQAATIGDLEGLYRHLEEAAQSCGFLDPRDPKRLRERLRRLFSRASLEREEVNIIRGLLRALTRQRDGSV
jgi:TrmH family RNA methyltransferase